MFYKSAKITLCLTAILALLPFSTFADETTSIQEIEFITSQTDISAEYLVSKEAPDLIPYWSGGITMQFINHAGTYWNASIPETIYLAIGGLGNANTSISRIREFELPKIRNYLSESQRESERGTVRMIEQIMFGDESEGVDSFSENDGEEFPFNHRANLLIIVSENYDQAVSNLPEYMFAHEQQTNSRMNAYVYDATYHKPIQYISEVTSTEEFRHFHENICQLRLSLDANSLIRGGVVLINAEKLKKDTLAEISQCMGNVVPNLLATTGRASTLNYQGTQIVDTAMHAYQLWAAKQCRERMKNRSPKCAEYLIERFWELKLKNRDLKKWVMPS